MRRITTALLVLLATVPVSADETSDSSISVPSARSPDGIDHQRARGLALAVARVRGQTDPHDGDLVFCRVASAHGDTTLNSGVGGRPSTSRQTSSTGAPIRMSAASVSTIAPASRSPACSSRSIATRAWPSV